MPIPQVGPGSGPDLPALDPPASYTAPTLPFFPPRPNRPHLENLSPRERGVAMPRGLSGIPGKVRIALLALGVLLLVGCCVLSWGTVSALIPPPGGPIAIASTAASGSSTASLTASATDQSTATDSGTPSASPTRTPAPTSTPRSTPTPTPCPDPYNNPWGYNFCTPGTLIYNPPFPAFCSVFPCVGKFWSQSGYVVECRDGLFAHDGGFVTVCAKDGGYLRTLYQHPAG